MLEDCLCPLCDNKATVIHTEDNNVKGALCKRCHNLYSRFTQDEWLLKAENYSKMLHDFPFTRPYLFVKIDTDQLEFEFDG